MPKVPTTPSRDKVINLQALSQDKAEPAISLLYPVHTFLIYLDHTIFRDFVLTNKSLSVLGDSRRGSCLQIEVGPAIALIYQAQGMCHAILEFEHTPL